MTTAACLDFNALFSGHVETTDAAPQAAGCADHGCDVTRMAAGADHVCAVLRNGNLYCWGSNAVGQLGRGTHGDWSNQPQQIERAADGSTVGGIVDLALGRAHTCALRGTGALLCWGDAEYGQVAGAGSTHGAPFERDQPQRFDLLPIGCCHGCCNTPLPLTALGKGAMADHACALLGDGGPYCWGYNQHQQLGYTDGGDLTTCGGGTEEATCSSTPYPAVMPSDAGTMGSVSVGVSFTCAVSDRGVVFCGGDESSGQLANGHYEGVPSEFPFGPIIGLPSGLSVQAIASGATSSCAVAGDGSVWCWGGNDQQQLGHPTGANGGDTCCSVEPCGTFPSYCNPRATKVAGLSDVVSVGLGAAHACAIDKSGSVYCWGSNDKSQLGSLAPGGPTPLRVRGVDDAVGLAVGANHTCVWKRDGSAACWGLNDQGQLANGTENSDAPLPVVGLPP